MGRKRKKIQYWSQRQERPKGLFSILRPQQCSKWSSVKKPHPNPQLMKLLWANNTSKGPLSLPVLFPLWKGEVTPCQGCRTGDPQPCHSRTDAQPQRSLR